MSPLSTILRALLGAVILALVFVIFIAVLLPLHCIDYAFRREWVLRPDWRLIIESIRNLLRL